MATIPRVEDAVNTLVNAIQAAVSAAQTANGTAWPGQVVAGNTVSTELAAIIGQGKNNHLIVVWPLPGKNVGRYSAFDEPGIVLPTSTLTSSIAGQTVTFSGTPAAGQVVHVFVGRLVTDVFYVVQGTDTLTSIASNVAAAITAAAVSGVTATPAGTSVTVTNSPYFLCNIGGTGGSITFEVARWGGTFQATVYAPDPHTRSTIGEYILSGVGTAITRSYSLSDGETMFCKIEGMTLVEKAQSSYSAYEWHIMFHVEYPITYVAPVQPVEAVIATQTIQHNSAGASQTSTIAVD